MGVMRSGFEGRLMEYSLAVHRMVDKLPGAEENDPAAQMLVISSMMIGPKYAGIVEGLDRGHVIGRLELCCGNANEAVYWLEDFRDHHPEFAEECERLLVEGRDIAAILDERMHSISRPN
jgi:hypothetical protein